LIFLPNFNLEWFDGRDVLKAWGKEVHLGLDLHEESIEGNHGDEQPTLIAKPINMPVYYQV